MKAILEFNLDEAEDVESHYRCISALDLTIILYEMDNKLRGLLKHTEMEDKEYDRVEEIRDFLLSSMRDKGLSFDKLLT